MITSIKIKKKKKMLVYYKDIFNFVTKLVGDKETAKDITQEAYAKCIELDSNKEINRSFLYKVAKNIVIDESRKNKKITEKTKKVVDNTG